MWVSEYLQLLRTGKFSESYQYKFEHIPNWLYRYRKDDPLHIENLINDQDWFSYPCDFNDPFDTCITLSEEQYFNDLRKLTNENKFPAKNYMNEQELKIYAHKTYPDAIKTLNNKFRSQTFQICCYSEQLFSIPMWAHYAGNHTGFCIAYSDYNKTEGHDLFPVIYSEDSIKIRSEFFSDIQNASSVGALMPIIHKYKDWSYEREWRLLKRTDNKATPLKNPLFIKKPSTIYLGVNCSEKLKSSLESIAQKKKISIYKMEADYSKIGLKVIPLNNN